MFSLENSAVLWYTFLSLKQTGAPDYGTAFFRETITGNDQRKYDHTAYNHAGTSEKAGNQDSAPNGKNEGATKYKVVTTEKVKYLKFIPARFEVVEEVTYILQKSFDIVMPISKMTPPYFLFAQA